MRFFLGIELIERSDDIFICQRKYTTEVLKRFEIQYYNSVCNPIVTGQKNGKDENGTKMDTTFFKQIVGSLIYLTTRSYVCCQSNKSFYSLSNARTFYNSKKSFEVLERYS